MVRGNDPRDKKGWTPLNGSRQGVVLNDNFADLLQE